MTDPLSPQDAARLAVAQAICKSRTCEGADCCQWPANRGRVKCPVKAGGYDAAADAAIAKLARLCAPTDLAAAAGRNGNNAYWQDLLDKDDRISPEEYPDMALITREELLGYIADAVLIERDRLRAPTGDAMEASKVLLNQLLAMLFEGHDPKVWNSNDAVSLIAAVITAAEMRGRQAERRAVDETDLECAETLVYGHIDVAHPHQFELVGIVAEAFSNRREAAARQGIEMAAPLSDALRAVASAANKMRTQGHCELCDYLASALPCSCGLAELCDALDKLETIERRALLPPAPEV